MRLVQLSRHSIAFPSPEGALREPNGLLALGGDLSPRAAADGLSAWYFSWFSLATRSSGGRPTPGRYFGQSNSISAAA